MLLKVCHATAEGMSDENYVRSQTTTEELWVEKYAPKSFTELLSDEQTNREVYNACILYFITTASVTRHAKSFSVPSLLRNLFILFTDTIVTWKLVMIGTVLFVSHRSYAG